MSNRVTAPPPIAGNRSTHHRRASVSVRTADHPRAIRADDDIRDCNLRPQVLWPDCFCSITLTREGSKIGKVINHSPKGIHLQSTILTQLFNPKKETFLKLRTTHRYIKGPKGLVMTKRKKIDSPSDSSPKKIKFADDLPDDDEPLNDDEIASFFAKDV
ncbi:unnamed protein product [Vicia faba]|uniref:Uncharacterized protein n=1 Tax=Vicia faba TaxID=3906 RepID=A0AAV0YE74_VICFA|nr:unnamed protein product [Vicia faba]